MQSCVFARNSQTQTRATCGASTRRVASPKAVKNSIWGIAHQAGAVISHHERNTFTVAGHRDFNRPTITVVDRV